MGYLLKDLTVEENSRNGMAKKIADLVSELHENGDELCRELIHVSFFELWIT